MTSEPLRRQLGAELRRLRTLAGLSQSDIGSGETGVSQASVSRYERGERLPSRAEAELWLDATGAVEEDRERVMTLLDAAHTPDVLPSGPLTDERRARVAEHLRAALRLVEDDEPSE